MTLNSQPAQQAIAAQVVQPIREEKMKPLPGTFPSDQWPDGSSAARSNAEPRA